MYTCDVILAHAHKTHVHNYIHTYTYTCRWGAILGSQTLSSGRCVVQHRVDVCAPNTYVGLAFVDVRLNEGATKRNIVLRETGEVYVYGDKTAVVEGFGDGETAVYVCGACLSG